MFYYSLSILSNHFAANEVHVLVFWCECGGHVRLQEGAPVVLDGRGSAREGGGQKPSESIWV